MNPPSWGLVVVRIVVGFVILLAAWQKVQDGVTDHVVLDTAPAWAAAPDLVRSWGEGFVLKHPTFLAHLAVWGELVIGLALFLGAFTRPLGFAGAILYAHALVVVPDSTRPLVLVVFAACLGCAISCAGARSGLDVFLNERLPSALTWTRG